MLKKGRGLTRYVNGREWRGASLFLSRLVIAPDGRLKIVAGFVDAAPAV